MVVEFTEEELALIVRLLGNLMSSAVEANLDPDILESAYYKSLNSLDSDREYGIIE